MATMVPDGPADFNSSEGEAEVFDALRKLDDKCYVFHSLRWLSPISASPSSRLRLTQGEADFAVLHPEHGILVIEVKSGGLRCTGERWFQKNRFTNVEKEICDPEKQATRSVFALKDTVDRALPFGERCKIFAAVWFPSVKFPYTSLPLNYAPDMILDEESLHDPVKSVERAFYFWESALAPTARTKLSASGTKILLNTVAPAFSVVPSMRSAFESRERQLVRLTNEQTRILEFLDDQKSAVIAGAAWHRQNRSGARKGPPAQCKWRECSFRVLQFSFEKVSEAVSQYSARHVSHISQPGRVIHPFKQVSR